jgi:hypothetical protein
MKTYNALSQVNLWKPWKHSFLLLNLLNLSQQRLPRNSFCSWQYIRKTLNPHKGRSAPSDCLAKWEEPEIRLKTKLVLKSFSQTLREIEPSYITNVFGRRTAKEIHLPERNITFHWKSYRRKYKTAVQWGAKLLSQMHRTILLINLYWYSLLYSPITFLISSASETFI